jgi:hypothetical protein
VARTNSRRRQAQVGRMWRWERAQNVARGEQEVSLCGICLCPGRVSIFHFVPSLHL